MSDMSRICSIGLMTTDCHNNFDEFFSKACETTYDFVATPISKPSFRQVLNEKNEMDSTAHKLWKNRPAYNKKDLILSSSDWSEKSIGLLPDWIDLESPSSEIAQCSEIALKQETDWACHIGLQGLIFPTLPKGTVANTARVINRIASSLTMTQFAVKVPLTDPTDVEGNGTWKKWNQLRTLADNNSRINVALELTAELPKNRELLDVWFAEPVKTVIVPGDIFISNTKGYPVLPKGHQQFIKEMMTKMGSDFIVTNPRTPMHKSATMTSYGEYIAHLNRTLPELTEAEQCSAGYQDFMQAPLQPLMDNLENQTYEVFEKDPIKYQQYEKAVYKALIDRVDHESDYETVIMVVGAGRGPLVNCCLRASDKSERKVHIFALEKNPNAFVTLQAMKEEVWQDKVTLVFADMRDWNPPKKCDILVSELLGSFGDNELSPECLDGAQKFIKPDGISIPASYTTFISPLASTKLCNDVNSFKDLTHIETPYVVLFCQVHELAPCKPLWVFEHPNHHIEADKSPLNNQHNMRHSQLEFDVDHDTVMHGIAGYFESVLYKDVMISIRPETHSPGMFSWFPIFFPIRTPIQVPRGSTVIVDYWRLTDTKKVWYEWSVVVKNKQGENTAITAIHNVGGRSSWVGL
ncbi:PRMT5 arginine-N-methyltransferase-domain-containing protein [Pilobolus umbonatus]|nr:PRMT5 arginine-N-methyltransferase-domain-containing protein [Pilobolus umbonatus]